MVLYISYVVAYKNSNSKSRRMCIKLTTRAMVGGEPENPSPVEDDSANGGQRVCGVGGKAAADAVAAAAAAAAVASCI